MVRTIILTGQTVHGKHLVLVDRQKLWMTASEFQLVCRLLAAKCSRTTGYADGNLLVQPLLVHRARRRLAEAARDGEAAIQTGGYGRYRFDPQIEFQIDQSFAELPSSALPFGDFEILKRHFGLDSPQDAGV